MKPLRKLSALFRRKKLDAEMAEELRGHLELQTERNLADGLSPEEARYAARRQFGGVEQVKEQARAQRGLVWLENVLRDSAVTFFAPTDFSVQKVMNIINGSRHEAFKDSLKLAEVPADVWKRYLSRYIFRDKYMLKDVPRFMLSQLDLYPGMNMESWQGYVMNLGVIFSDYNGTRDVGPRQLILMDVGSLEHPNNIIALVASSDMQTANGVVHVLNSDHTLGFNANDFVRLVNEYLK